MTDDLKEQERVEVHFGGDILPGHIARISQTQPDGRTIKVLFDDPLVYGGAGAGWFKPIQVTRPRPERTPR